MREIIKKVEALKALKFLTPKLCDFFEGWGELNIALEIGRMTFTIKIEPVN